MSVVTEDRQVAAGADGALAAANADRPWLGLRPYDEQDHALYFGRDDDVDTLNRLVRGGRMTLLFGKSGLGKTSLLRAGLFPREKKEDALPVYVRLDYDSETPLSEQVKHAIAAAAAANRMEAPPVVEGESLWEYLHLNGGEFWSEDLRMVLPLIVFDQFEEIFTVGRDSAEQSARFVAELSDLVEERVPESVRIKIRNDPEAAQRYALDRHHYKVIVSLREDFMADLDRLQRDLPPALFQHRMRLNPLTGSQGMDIVLGPGTGIVTSGVAEEIVRHVGEPEGAPLGDLVVEPALLSLLCQQLNEKRLERGEAQITSELVEEAADKVLFEFYQESLENLPRDDGWGPFQTLHSRIVHEYIEGNLVTPDGFRDSVDRGRAEKEIGSKAAVEALIVRRILQVDARDHSRQPRLELAHDVLVEQVQASSRHRDKAGLKRLGLLLLLALLAWPPLAIGSGYLGNVIEWNRVRPHAEVIQAQLPALRGGGSAAATAADTVEARVNLILRQTISPPPPPQPLIAAVQVTVESSGDDIDPDGYSVLVAGANVGNVGANGSLTFERAAATNLRVELGGVAANCSVAGGNANTVDAIVGETAATSFEVVCETRDPDDADTGDDQLAAFDNTFDAMVDALNATSASIDAAETVRVAADFAGAASRLQAARDSWNARILTSNCPTADATETRTPAMAEAISRLCENRLLLGERLDLASTLLEARRDQGLGEVEAQDLVGDDWRANTAAVDASNADVAVAADTIPRN